MTFSENFNSSDLLDMENIDFLSVLNRLDDGVIIADVNGTILFYNTAQSKIDGLNPKDVIGLNPKDVIGLKVADIYDLNNRTSMIMQVIYHSAAIKKNRLRTDLFYRLAVIMVKLPALRQRQNCMDDLVNHFIEKYNNRLGTHVKLISKDVLELFTAYQWPGNVRELEHLIEGAMNMAGHEEIIGIQHFTPGIECLEQVDSTCSKIPFPLRKGPSTPSFEEPAPVSHSSQSLAQTQSEREKSVIQSTLLKTGGNVTKAAKSLGISRQLLHYKIKKHGFFRGDFLQRPPV